MRKVIYVSGTRADFGLIRSSLDLINESPDLALSVCVTGMHLSDRYGGTVAEIIDGGFRVCGRVEVDLEETSGESMARAISGELAGFVDVFRDEQPDVVLILGDRGEMLAAAIAAIYMNIPIVHVHGGERSGTVDEPVRHAISKLAHYHLVATESSKQRLIRMGEQPDNVFVTGAPGLDGITGYQLTSRTELCVARGLDPSLPTALLVFHPVVQEAAEAGKQMSALLEALIRESVQIVLLQPNSDAGGNLIRKVVRQYASNQGIAVADHLPRGEFISWMSAVDFMIGNSSSGIIEAASLELPVINVGSRQMLRERSSNVVDAGFDISGLQKLIGDVLAEGKRQCDNVYGDGQAGRRIVKLLTELPLSAELMNKTNAY